MNDSYPSIPVGVDTDTYCTIALCPLDLAHVHYLPSVPGNAFYAGIFGLLMFVQLGLGIRYKTWGFMVGMCSGLLLEIIGYAGRIQIHDNPFRMGPFLMYLICLTIGPAFLSGSIYLCLSRIVVAHSESISLLKPRTYTLLFITCDFIALLLQAAGGALASTSDTESDNQVGINIMVAGVGWQVASLGIFAILCAEYCRRVRRETEHAMNPAFDTIRNSKRFYLFLWALGVATLTIFVRSVFRCAELSGGFDGKLANEQVTFMILEGAMIIIAVTSLSVLHPGLAFQGRWTEATWSLRGRSQTTGAPAANEKAEWYQFGRGNSPAGWRWTNSW